VTLNVVADLAVAAAILSSVWGSRLVEPEALLRHHCALPHSRIAIVCLANARLAARLALL